jgi:tetratricopeptide (TPR) repeat protein
VDSFIRDSAGSEDFGGFKGNIQPYYSPTRTVTGLSPRGRVLAPPSGSRIDSRVRYDVRDAGTGLYGPDTPLPQVRFRGFLALPDQQDITDESVKQFGKGLAEVKEGEEGEVSLSIINKDSDALRTDLNIESDKPLDLKVSSDIKSLEEENIKEIAVRSDMPEQEGEGVFEQMRAQLAELEKEAVESVSEESEEGEELVEEPTMAERIRDIDLNSAKAKEILGEHKTFASYSRGRFNKNMLAAEEYMKKGEYYKAVDSYTLAQLYEPKNPLASAGKSHALLAAGEYMSSALFLSRALEVFADYALVKVDLISMIGDQDVVDSRVVEIKEWIKRSGSGELYFLLSYIYYQTGRIDEAKEAIEQASLKLVDVKSVENLAIVIRSLR